MTSLLTQLSTLAGDAFAAAGLPRELGVVRVSDRPDLAQFQCNGAMAAAKVAKKNPRTVAEEVVARLKERPEFSRVEIAGPGFINLDVNDEVIARALVEMAGDDRLGVPVSGAGTIVVDYGGPNVAKAMHVGHLRPAIIGDCIKRLVRHAGYTALGDVHMGDWGLPIGQIISEFEIRFPGWPYFDPDYTGAYPDEVPFTYSVLEKIYPEASQACKDDPARRELARKATADLQAGRRGYRALWSKFMPMSISDMKANYDSLGITFELWKGEADVADLITVVEADLKQKGLAVMSDGALVVPVALESDNKEVPPLMFYKSDGAVGYATTDLATIYERARDYADLRALIYVVDKRQSLHFEQVFRAAHRAGYRNGIPCLFIGFGTLNGPDNKPFKSRDGGIMKFSEMVGQALEKARMRLTEAELGQELSSHEREEIAHKVAIAAIKFADLQNQAQSNYIFDIDRMSSFEGKTGPYLLYQAVRIKSLLSKADDWMMGGLDDWKEKSIIQSSNHLIIQDVDRPLALLLTEWPEAFASAVAQYAPHIICDYAYRLARTFSAFYGACHILSEADQALRESRLALCTLTAKTLETALELLGIEVPVRM